MKAKTVRDRSGKAVSMEMTLNIGLMAVRLSEPISVKTTESMARVKAEAALYKRAYETQAMVIESRSMAGFPSMEQWFEHWFHARYVLALWGNRLSKSGRESVVRSMWSMVPDEIRAQPVDSIRSPTLSRLFTDLAVDHSSSYLHAFHVMLSSIFNDAIKYGWDDGNGRPCWRARDNPMLLVRRQLVQTKEKRILSSDELIAILAENERRLGRHHWTTGVLALQTLLGLRVNEAAGLKWEQISLEDRGEVAGVISWSPEQRKSGVPLRLPIPRHLMTYLPPKRDAGHVWRDTPQTTKHRSSSMNRELRESARLAGIKDYERITSHCLRHSFAHDVYKSRSASDVKRLLGHTSEATTMRYLRGCDDMERVTGIVLDHANSIVN